MKAASQQHHTVAQADAQTTSKTSTVEKLLYSKADASHALSISTRAVSYLISKGEISVRRLGGRTLIPKGEVVRLSRQDIASLTS